jgi:hypothetical protein
VTNHRPFHRGNDIQVITYFFFKKEKNNIHPVWLDCCRWKGHTVVCMYGVVRLHILSASSEMIIFFYYECQTRHTHRVTVHQMIYPFWNVLRAPYPVGLYFPFFFTMGYYLSELNMQIFLSVRLYNLLYLDMFFFFFKIPTFFLATVIGHLRWPATHVTLSGFSLSA